MPNIYIPTFAVYNLRAYAAHYAKGMADSDTVEIGEYTINNQMEDILEGIYKAKPDVLMFSCYIWNIAFVEELAEEFHKLRPEVPVWVGGPEVSYETESFFKRTPADHRCDDRGREKTFCELAEYYAGKSRETKKSRKYRKHREQERVKARRKDRNLEKSQGSHTGTG